MQLQGRITDLENKIAGMRTGYNQDVNDYNIRIQQFPASFVAGFMHLAPHPLFQVAETDREDVKVSFT
jgi:LemA protein